MPLEFCLFVFVCVFLGHGKYWASSSHLHTAVSWWLLAVPQLGSKILFRCRPTSMLYYWILPVWWPNQPTIERHATFFNHWRLHRTGECLYSECLPPVSFAHPKSFIFLIHRQGPCIAFGALPTSPNQCVFVKPTLYSKCLRLSLTYVKSLNSNILLWCRPTGTELAAVIGLSSCCSTICGILLTHRHVYHSQEKSFLRFCFVSWSFFGGGGGGWVVSSSVLTSRAAKNPISKLHKP